MLGVLDKRYKLWGDVFGHMYTRKDLVLVDASVVVPEGGLEIGAVLELTTSSTIYNQVDSTTAGNAVAVLAQCAMGDFDYDYDAGGTFTLAVAIAGKAPIGVNQRQLSYDEDSAWTDDLEDTAVAALETAGFKMFDQA